MEEYNIFHEHGMQSRLLKKIEIIKWLKYRIDTNTGNQITNWHLNDDLGDFEEEFYKNKPLKDAHKTFARYCRVLVDYGYLFPPTQHGLGCGGMYEFGCRTQTVWKKNPNFLSDIEPNELMEQRGMKITLLEHRYFKKHGKYMDRSILSILKGEVNNNKILTK